MWVGSGAACESAAAANYLITQIHATYKGPAVDAGEQCTWCTSRMENEVIMTCWWWHIPGWKEITSHGIMEFLVKSPRRRVNKSDYRNPNKRQLIVVAQRCIIETLVLNIIWIFPCHSSGGYRCDDFIVWCCDEGHRELIGHNTRAACLHAAQEVLEMCCCWRRK